MDDFDELAAERAHHTSIPADLWLPALASAFTSLDGVGLADRCFEELAEDCARPEHFVALASCLAAHAKASGDADGAFADFALSVDESAYDMRAWAEALHVFTTWLSEHRLPVDFEAMLGYLDCCAEVGNRAGCTLPFPKVVLDMLNAHGFTNNPSAG